MGWGVGDAGSRGCCACERRAGSRRYLYGAHSAEDWRPLSCEWPLALGRGHGLMLPCGLVLAASLDSAVETGEAASALGEIGGHRILTADGAKNRWQQARAPRDHGARVSQRAIDRILSYRALHRIVEPLRWPELATPSSSPRCPFSPALCPRPWPCLTARTPAPPRAAGRPPARPSSAPPLATRRARVPALPRRRTASRPCATAPTRRSRARGRARVATHAAGARRAAAPPAAPRARNSRAPKYVVDARVGTTTATSSSE